MNINMKLICSHFFFRYFGTFSWHKQNAQHFHNVFFFHCVCLFLVIFFVGAFDGVFYFPFLRLSVCLIDWSSVCHSFCLLFCHTSFFRLRSSLCNILFTFFFLTLWSWCFRSAKNSARFYEWKSVFRFSLNCTFRWHIARSYDRMSFGFVVNNMIRQIFVRFWLHSFI